MRRVIVATLFCATAVLTACGGGSSGGSVAPTPTQGGATPTPSAGALSVSPSSEEFTATGASYAQTVTLKQSGFAGAYAESDDCSGIATVTAGTSSTSFVITPVGAGTCKATFSGGNSQAAVSIGVTTSSVGVQ